VFFGETSIGYNDRIQNFRPTAWGMDPRYIWIQH